MEVTLLPWLSLAIRQRNQYFHVESLWLQLQTGYSTVRHVLCNKYLTHDMVFYDYYLDSAYTERYMSSPQKNWRSYAKASVLNKAINMKGKKYLLVHGTADGNHQTFVKAIY